MIAQSPHFVVSTASTRFDDGEQFLTANLARGAEERNDDEGTHGHAGGDGDTEVDDVVVGGGANDSQTEGEDEGEASAAAADPLPTENWGTAYMFCMYVHFRFV